MPVGVVVAEANKLAVGIHSTCVEASCGDGRDGAEACGDVALPLLVVAETNKLAVGLHSACVHASCRHRLKRDEHMRHSKKLEHMLSENAGKNRWLHRMGLPPIDDDPREVVKIQLEEHKPRWQDAGSHYANGAISVDWTQLCGRRESSS